MSVKKFQQVNLSYSDNSWNTIINEINILVKKIKSGSADNNEVKVCENLARSLQNIIAAEKDIDPLDVWLAKEAIEMSKYTCKRYVKDDKNDKI